MPLEYKVDILEELKKAGYNTTRIRRERLMGESVLQKLRERKPLSWNELGTICQLLNCQPGDLIQYHVYEVPVIERDKVISMGNCAVHSDEGLRALNALREKTEVVQATDEEDAARVVREQYMNNAEEYARKYPAADTVSIGAPKRIDR